MVFNVHRNHKAYWGLGEGEVGEREIIYLLLHCHHQNDFCIKVGSNESHLMFHNCEGQNHKTVSADYNLWSERRAEADSNSGPSAYQPTTLLLGQTGSLRQISFNCLYKMTRIPLVLKKKKEKKKKECAKQNQSRTTCWPSWSSSGRRPSSGAVKPGTHLAAATFTSNQRQCLMNKGQTFPSQRIFVHQSNWNLVI